MKKRRMVALLLSAAMTFSAMPESVIATENAASAIGSSEDAVTSESAIDVGETSTDEDALDANKTAAEEESEEKGTKLEAMELGDGQWFENAAFSDYSVTKTDNSATISITKQGKGKISSADENLAMLMHEIPQNNDFVMTCDMTVDAYNTLGTENNPQQSAFGVGIFNEIPQYVQNESTWVKNIMLQSYMTSSSASVASIGGFVREKASKDMKNPAFTFVSDLGATSGSNLGTYSLEVKKSGKSYVISLDGKSWAYDATDLLDADSVYLSFFVARNAAITISNLNLDIDERTVTNLKLNKMPEKTSYLLNDSSYDLTGIEVEAEFSDGTTDIVNPDNCVVSGFDTTTKGSKVMKLTKGGVSVDIPYTVIGLECTDIDVVYAPVLNVYYIGTKFDTTGISVNATYSDGTSETLDSDKYELLLDGTTPITDGQYFTASDVGKHTIVVKRVTDASYETGTGEGSFDINVENFTFSAIKVQASPLNTLYYTGDELDTSGLAVSAVYSAPNGALRYVLLKDDEYTISGFDSSKVAEKNTVTITSVVNPELTTSFDVEIRETNIVYYAVTYYPRLTYQLGESFDFDDLEVSYYYNNGTYVPTKEYTLDADDVAEFNRVTNLSATDFAALVAAENPDDSSADSVVRSINIVPNLADKPNIELKLTIRTPDEHEQVWKDVVFGASAKRGNNTVTHNADGSVTVSSLNGGGKMTADNDGLCYYYTRVDADKNFILDAEITVDYYLNDASDDTKRNGQEAFGIMARDIIPFASIYGEDYTFDRSEAQLDAYGEPVPSENAQGKTVSSNMVMVGGYSGTGWPLETAINYVKYSNINRINLYARSNVTDPTEGAGTKNGPTAVSSTFPKAGNRYRIALQKVGDDYHATCWDYQNLDSNGNPTRSEANDTIEQLLDLQNKEDMFVGFFASRYAAFTINSYSFNVTDPENDVYFGTTKDEEYTAGITLVSDYFSSTSDYNLVIKANNKLGGYADIKVNDELVYRSVSVGNKNVGYAITLNKNTSNTVTVSYTASTGDICNTYEPVVTRYDIVECENVPTTEVIYCSPDGTPQGDGTKANPLDVRTATGLCVPGQNVVCLEGTYLFDREFRIPETNSGFPALYKVLKADDGAKVVFDMQYKSAGMVLIGDYWEIDGIEFVHSADNTRPFDMCGDYGIVRNCKFHDNGDTGFQVSRVGDAEGIENWPTGNKIINCESWNNADPASINADGFGAKLTVGYGTVFEGCVSHHNLDDGWDTFTKTGTGAIGSVTLINCISYKQGYKLNDDGSETPYPSGGHNGFKMGGENVFVQHYLQDCISFENSNGITSNSNPGMKIRGFVSYNNTGANFALYSNTAAGKRQYNYNLKYCVSYKGGSKDRIGGYTEDLGNGTADTTNSVPYVDENGDTIYLAQKDADGALLYNKNAKKYADENNTPYSIVDTDENGNPVKDADGNYVYARAYINRSKVDAGNETNYWNGTNSLGKTVTDSFFKSVKKADSLVDNGRYAQEADGTYIRGDFLARADGFTYASSGEVEEDDNETTTETTTSATTSTKGSSGGGGGGGGSSKTTTTTTVAAVEADTEATTSKNVDKDTEATTETAKVAFDDISNRAWAVDAITKLANAGIVNGVSANKFAPDALCKRGDFILVISNILSLEGEFDDDFTDVPANKYYADAIAAAKNAGIATGYEDGTFKPEDTITRQDMMVLVAKALEYTGTELDEDVTALDTFADGDEVSDYAKPYVAALVKSAFVNGTDKGIEPKALITRAQMACLVAPLYDLVAPTSDEDSTVEVDVDTDEVEETSEETTEETTTAKVVRGTRRVASNTETTTEASTSSEDEEE